MQVDVPEWMECVAGPLEQARPTSGRLAKPVAPWESEQSAAREMGRTQAPVSEGVVGRLPGARLRLAARWEVFLARGREPKRPRRTPWLRRALAPAHP